MSFAFLPLLTLTFIHTYITYPSNNAVIILYRVYGQTLRRKDGCMAKQSTTLYCTDLKSMSLQDIICSGDELWG